MIYFKIFLLALFLRLLCLGIIQYYEIPTLLTLEQTEKYLFSTNPPKEIQLADASDYYYTSINLEVPKFLGEYYGYSNWYERQPLHVLVLYLTKQSILFQILLSTLTVLLLFRMNHIVGLIYAFYPQSIIYSCMFTKVTLMVFLMVLAVYLFKKPYKIVIAFIIIQLMFTSIFNYFPHTSGIAVEFQRGLWNKFWGLWQPTFNHTFVLFGNWIQYIQMPFYILVMIAFLRSRVNYVWLIAFIMSIGAMIQYAHPFHREIIIPLILLNINEELFS
jgi:hypothetical protein